MKRIFSIFLVALMFSTLAIPVSAAEAVEETGISRSMISSEIPMEMAVAKEVLAGPCVLAEEKIDEAGEYVIVSRFYVAEESQVVNAGSTRSIGVLSAVTWYKRGQSAWTYKVQLAGWFDYDGTEATCVEDSLVVVDSSYNNANYYAEWRYLSGKVAAVNVYCEITEEVDQNLPATLMVTCTKDGELGYRSDDRYFS